MTKSWLVIVSLWIYGHTVFAGKSIEGSINIIHARHNSWIKQIKIRAYAGDEMFSGELRDDGSFIIHDIPNKLFIVEVRHIHEEYVFTPVRVDLTGEEIIASKINDNDFNRVIPLPYPLVFTGQIDSKNAKEYSTWAYLLDLLVLWIMISLFSLALYFLRRQVENQERQRRNVLCVVLIVLLLFVMSKILPE